MPDPFFSIVVPTYNREQMVRRCIDSCLAQTFLDFEVVVVDDASTDRTVRELSRIDDSRLRIVTHDRNRGINPSRHTGVENSRGLWIAIVDSDWEIFPNALQRLHEVIQELPDDVRIVRNRMLWDDGRITPATVPVGPIDYVGHIRRMEAEMSEMADTGQCLHRSVFDANPYFSDRRGVVEALYELNLAKSESSIYIEDVLGKEYSDAPNSWMRSVDAAEVIPRLRREAPDMLWMAETTLQIHGPVLADIAPRAYRMFLRMASTQAFLIGDRKKGVRFGIAALRRHPFDPMAIASLCLGLIGPRASAWAALIYRRLNRWRRSLREKRIKTESARR